MVISLYADTTEAEIATRRDLVDEITKKIRNTPLGQNFDLNIIPSRIARDYLDIQGIKKLHRRVRGDMYIYGRVRRRQGADGWHYFISLDGYVTHAPIDVKISEEISIDFRNTLPPGINFQDTLSFQNFDVTAETVVRSVEFILGLAAFVSGNAILAAQLHTELLKRLGNLDLTPADRHIKSKLEKKLAEEHALISAIAYISNNVDVARHHLNLSEQYDQGCYNMLIMKSNLLFALGDTDGALKALDKCHGYNDPVWRYNTAFLRFWRGEYALAWKQCDAIKKSNYGADFNTSVQVTDFNNKILQTDQSRPILYFWIGFNYYFKQHNLPKALEALDAFMQNTDEQDKDMATFRAKANGWLVEIRKEMSL